MGMGVYHDVCHLPESVVHSVTHRAWSAATVSLSTSTHPHHHCVTRPLSSTTLSLYTYTHSVHSLLQHREVSDSDTNIV